ncbi:DNA-processing protein DprA [Kitasatospora cineracea]|uniref:DNA-processing protein DprA n=1 Tax=Kitasatospora cineracea TaxID=88074 RepID=UPI0038257A61
MDFQSPAALQGGRPGELPEMHRDLLALCALRVGDKSVDWSLLARTCESADDIKAMFEGNIREQSETARKSLPILRTALAHLAEARERVAVELEAAELAGARIVTVLDAAYPSNLREVPDRPPFLFYLGNLSDADRRSVAVVGTRGASEDGISRAKRMSKGLVAADVAVYSGLALGIDSAAHVAALEAGGRTVAVLGHGIASKVYPAVNEVLAKQIVHEGGALFSQFWPLSRPATWTFPRRNVVTSGSALGSIVIEASRTSGAKMQARIASEHGKRVFLLRSLVAQESWAAKMVAVGRAVEVATLDDVLDRLDSAPAPLAQVEDPYHQLSIADL